MRSRYRWVICALLFFATAVNYLDRQVLSLTWKDFIAPEFKWTDADYGVITGCFSLIYAVCNLFAGKFVDWMGSKRGYLWAIFVWSLAACLHAVCGVGAAKIATFAALSVTTVSVWLFLACRSLLAVGESGNFPAAIKVTAEYFPPSERAFATSIFNSGASIGALIAPATIPLIARHWGWESAFILIGALGFVWMFFWAFLYERDESKSKVEVEQGNENIRSSPSPSTSTVSYLKLFTLRQTWALMLGLFLTNGVWWFFLFWIPGYLSDQFGYSSDSGMGMLLVFTLYAIVTLVSIGLCKLPTYLMVRRGMEPYAGRMRAMLVFALIPILALGAQPLGAVSAWFPTVLIALACAGHQAWSANVYSVVGDMFPKPVIATLVGIAQCAGGVGSFLVNILAGRLFTYAASRGDAFAFAGQVGKPAGYMIVFCFCGVAYLLAWICMKLLVPQGGVGSIPFRCRAAVLLIGSCALMAHGEPAGARNQLDFATELVRPVLPAAASNSSFRVAFGEMEAADRQCDDAWRRLRTKEEVLAYGRTMREKFIASMGGFPKEGCPLNAQTVTTVQRDGYKVEKVLFETWPGVHVTANLLLPDDPKYRPPYPAVLLTCGHTLNGKGADMYQRGAVLAAKSGLACLIYDPYCQGERSQRTDTNVVDTCSEHNRFGALASLLGFSAARYRIWDGMRALDYLESRTEVDRTRIGCMGQSGGGTMTSLFTAIEPRLTATCPACYISTYRASAANIGPGDAEQNHFAQFPMGINNAALILMAAPRPVRLHFTHDDFFPFKGALETYGLIRETAEKFGWGGRYSMTDVDGPHHWNESLRTSSVEWMRFWLYGDKSAFKHDLEGYRALDLTWNAKTSDIGLANGGELVAPKGWVRNLPGERRIFDVLRDELDAAESARRGKPTADKIREIAGIRETPLVRKELGRKAFGDVTVVRAAYRRANGLDLPAVAFVPKAAKGAPVLVVGNGPRQKRAEQVRLTVVEGRPVVAVDLTATGEIGARKHAFYDCPAPEEEVAIYLYTLGRSLVGEQAGEILSLARALKAQFGVPAEIVAFDRTGIAAVHARAVEPELIGRVGLVNPPPSWTDSVRKELSVPFATVVNGALRRYDWTSLRDDPFTGM